MAAPRRPDIELSITPGTGLDQIRTEEGYADQERQRNERALGIPSPIEAGVGAMAETAIGGAERFGKGLMDLLKPVQAPGEPVLGGPDTPAGAVKTGVFAAGEKGQAVVDLAMGLVGIISAPGAGVGTAIQQAMRNLTPEQEKLVVFPGGPGGMAPLIRAMAGDTRPFGASEEARKAGSVDMTLGELANLVGQLGTMAALPGMARTLAKRGGEQRGSITFPPEAPQEAAGGAGIRGAESRVNIERVAAPESTKALMTKVNEMLSAKLAKHRETVTHEQTIREARPLTVEEAIAVEPMALTLEQAKSAQLAVRDVYNATAQHVDSLVKAVQKAGDDAAAQQLPGAWALLSDLAMKDEVLGATGARLLESRKILSEANRALFSPDDVTRMAAEMATEGFDGYRLARMLEPLTTAQRKTFGRQLMAGYLQGQSMLLEAWINALLSNPVTHAANMLSNALVAVWAPAERALSAMMDFGADRSVFIGEVPAMLKGAIEGFGDALQIMRKAWETKEVPKFGPEKIEFEPAITSANFGMAPENPLAAAVDFLGMAIRSPGTALRIEDVLFKAVNYRMELRAQAYRTAAQRGLEGPEFARVERDVIAYPERYPSVKARADEFALVQTFTAEFSGLSGALGSAVMGFRERVPILRVVVPFVRTPTNVLQYVGQRTPVLNLLSETLRQDIAAGGARRALAYGKITGGVMVASVAASLAAAGIITGSGPTDKTLMAQKRLTGWQPSSWKIGDTYYAIGRIGGLADVMGLVADFVEIVGELPEFQATELSAAIALAVSKHMVSKTFLEGLSSALESLQVDQTTGRNLGAFTKGLARSVVPAGVRQVTRTYTDPTLREARTLLDQVRAGIPGYSQTLPPRRNLWGDPIQLEGGWGWDMVSPIYVSTEKADPVADEIVRLKVRIAKPSEYIPVRLDRADLPAPIAAMLESGTLAQTTIGLKLTPEEYDRLAVLTGKEIKDPEGRNLHEHLEWLITQPEYREQSDGSDGGKALLIQKAVTLYKRLAMAQLQQESPELQLAIATVKGEAAIRRTPTAQQPAARGIVNDLIRSLGGR